MLGIFSFILSSFIIFIFLHIFIWRITKGYRGVLLILLVSAMSYALTLFIFSNFIKIQVPDFWILVPVYYCLIMLYCHLYVGILKSVSIRILEELSDSSDQTMSLSEIENLYPTKEMVFTRVSLLEEKGWLKQKGISYSCQNKAIFTVKINLFLQKTFRLRNTG